MMNCQRCLKGEKSVYRASSDVMDVNVCAACASEAWWLGLIIEVLDHEQQRKRVPNNGSLGERTGSLTLALPRRLAAVTRRPHDQV
jgi:hypothetical protein